MAVRAISKTTPLLELLEYRWKSEVQHIADPTLFKPSPRPKFTPAEEMRLRETAALHAQSDNSDPFAYGRAMRRMRSGEWLQSEARSDAIGRVHARVATGINIVSVGE